MARTKRSKPVRVVTGQGDFTLDEREMKRRFLERFYDPAFAPTSTELERIAELAWQAYDEYRKSPRGRRAGAAFADPEFELPLEWLETRKQIHAAERRRRSKRSRSRVLVVCASPRNDQTCPGEMSKTFRLASIARDALKRRRIEVDFLDLSAINAEYGRSIHPCKACLSTAQPLCHWPCSCYPNHALGQTNDWMNELYPRWVAAHGVLIVTPVNWYQAPSVLKLMMDRLVCADGGNPDPTATGGKDPERAKELELAGWSYPKHLAGRAFSVVVHGDAAGVETLRRILVDWLTDLELVPSGPHAGLGRYLGYYEPYATSHDDLDRDVALQTEVKNAALALAETVKQLRSGRYRRPDEGRDDPRKK